MLSGAIHEHLAAGGIPVDLQGATGKVEAGLPFREPQAVASHEGGAGTSAAGQGGTSAPLPHPHEQVIRGQHLHEVHVGFGREAGMNLEGGTKALEIDLLHGIHRNHHMGIAHAGGRHGKPFAIHLQLPLGQAMGADAEGGGHLIRLEEGGSHIHANRAIGQQLRHDATSQGVDLPGASRAIAIAIGEEAGQAADAIATHFRLAAIGVEDAHAQLTAGIGR